MKAQLISLIQKAINRYIALDPESASRLQHLKNKIVTIALKGVNVTFQLIFTDKIEIKLTPLVQADTVISGTPLRLLQMSFSGEKRHGFFSDDVTIIGDLELGQQVMDLFDQMEIAWEEYLSQWVGDVPAYHVGRFARRIKKISHQARETLLQNIDEYIHEEAEFFPSSEALQDFFHDIDELRMDADRVDARIQLLQKKLFTKRGLE